MDVEQAMTSHPHTTNLSCRSRGSVVPKPEQIKVTAKIDKHSMVDNAKNEPCDSIVTSTDSSALDMYLNEGGKVVGELHELVNEDRSLKSGYRAIEGYIRLLQLELELHRSLDPRRSYMGDTVCVLLDPLLNATELSVLECFMTHKGLHVLYDMLQHFRGIFEARHVVCKLMEILQHLHGQNMLVVERIQCDAPRFCMENFSKLLFNLSEHEDAEVRTVARRFSRLRLSIPRWHASHAKCWAWGSAAPHTKLHAATNYASGCKIL